MNRFFKTTIITLAAVLGVAGGLFGYIFFSLPDVVELIKENPQTTSFIEYRKQQAAEEGALLNVNHRWISIQQIPKPLIRTIIIAEDASFWAHEGFDWFEVKESLRRNWEEGKQLRGASTITQQTAKNLYLTPDRNWLRKLKEFFISRELEEHLSKTRILELYLNYIEFGEGIFGIKSAANFYFNKEPAELHLSEMIRLAAIIPKPLELRPDKPTKELKRRSNVILNRLKRYDWITEDEYLSAKAQLENFF